MENENKSPASQVASAADRATDLITGTDREGVGEAMSRARRNLSDHLHIGRLFSNPMEKTIALYTAEHGDTEPNRRYVMDAVYSYIETAFGRSRAAVRLYIRCYQHFGVSVDNETLTFRDMLLRLDDSNAVSAA
ncbi:hypothetical protein PTKU46_89770 [Paraburkholderia terrae]|uniref:hypothetical protein n=1 Tax=Paraburkholderia terrae TaxID=311230 RepID=UPI0030E1843E